MNDKDFELSDKEIEVDTEFFGKVIELIESGNVKMVKVTPEEAVRKVVKILEDNNDGR